MPIQVSAFTIKATEDFYPLGPDFWTEQLREGLATA